MIFSDLLEFRKDLFFEGAVQIDWFYDQTRAAKVAENFVFHGKDYFGVEENSLGDLDLSREDIKRIFELRSQLPKEQLEILPLSDNHSIAPPATLAELFTKELLNK